MFGDGELHGFDKRRQSTQFFDEMLGVDEGVELLEQSRRRGNDFRIVIERGFNARFQDGAIGRRKYDDHRHIDGKLDDEVGKEAKVGEGRVRLLRRRKIFGIDGGGTPV